MPAESQAIRKQRYTCSQPRALAGFPDPILATTLGPDNPSAQVSLTYAWETQDAPLKTFGVTNYSELTAAMSPLIHQPGLFTGKGAHEDPTSVRLAWQQQQGVSG